MTNTHAVMELFKQVNKPRYGICAHCRAYSGRAFPALCTSSSLPISRRFVGAGPPALRALLACVRRQLPEPWPCTQCRERCGAWLQETVSPTTPLTWRARPLRTWFSTRIFHHVTFWPNTASWARPSPWSTAPKPLSRGDMPHHAIVPRLCWASAQLRPHAGKAAATRWQGLVPWCVCVCRLVHPDEQQA